MPPEPKATTAAVKTAWRIALAADLLQWALLPLFAGGALSAVNVVLDVVVAAVLVRTLGWHAALIPTFAAELIPGVDLVPTWSAAVWLVTRSRPTTPGGR